MKCKDQLRPAEEAARSIEILTLKITMEGNLNNGQPEISTLAYEIVPLHDNGEIFLIKGND